MAEKGFGVKEINLIGASGTPTIESPNNLNLNAVNVAISTNATIGGNLTVTGNIGIAGTLTYEDVTNIDAIGIVTARSGLKVLAGGANVVGVVTATSFTGNGSALQNVIASNITLTGNNDNLVYRVPFASSNIGTPVLYSDADLTFNPSSGTLTATTFSGSGASLTGIAVTEAPVTDYTISANGSSAYRIHGGGVDETANSPDLYLIRGQKYRFNNTTGSSHPFALRVSNGGSGYADGVTGSQNGIQFFTVPYAAPASLVYQCTIHSGMIGNIYIRGGASTASISNNADNRVITGGSGGNLNGEANVQINSSGHLSLGGSNVTDVNLLTLNGSGASQNVGMVFNKTNSPAKAYGINVHNGTGDLLFYDYTASADRLRITSGGHSYFQQSVGIQTNNIDAANLSNPVGAGHSLVGLYIGDGSLLFSDQLARSGGYYITTGVNALNAGPVTLNSEMTLDGTWTIV